MGAPGGKTSNCSISGGKKISIRALSTCTSRFLQVASRVEATALLVSTNPTRDYQSFFFLSILFEVFFIIFLAFILGSVVG